MKYCSACGAQVALRVPTGDSLARYICTACHTIHYENPKMVVGSIPAWEDKILMCRRAIEPRYGFWTLPAGFMENHESTEQAAIRETHEEAHAEIEIGPLYTVWSIPHISQVHLFFRSRLLNLDFKAGSESLEVALFREAEMPWEQLAFASVRDTLKHYYSDQRIGVYGFHSGDILAPVEG